MLTTTTSALKARGRSKSFHNNATLAILELANNGMGVQSARSLAAALNNNATLTSLSSSTQGLALNVRGRSRRP
jgi:hypothetical protein